MRELATLVAGTVVLASVYHPRTFESPGDLVAHEAAGHNPGGG